MRHLIEENVEWLSEIFRSHENKTDHFVEAHLLARLDLLIAAVARIGVHRSTPAVRIALVLPTLEGQPMTIKIVKGTVDIAILMLNAEGETVKAPADEVFTPKSSDPALNVTIATMPGGPFSGMPSLRISGVVPVKAMTGLKVSVSDKDGLMSNELDIELAGDTVATSIKLDETTAFVS